MLTIKELSEELHLSKTAVSNRIKDLGLKSQLVRDGNKNLIPNNVADEVRRSFQDTKKIDKASVPNTDIVDVLSNQLQEKDRQIEMLMRQIEQLQAQNVSLLQTVQQGNYLLANTLGVAEPASEEPVNEEKAEQSTATDNVNNGRPGFFRRWFRK